MTIKVTVDAFECKKADALFRPRGSERLYVATVTVLNVLPGKKKPYKVTMGFSRYDTEHAWLADWQFVNGLPHFSHGEGSRCCMKQAAINEVEQALDAAKEAFDAA